MIQLIKINLNSLYCNLEIQINKKKVICINNLNFIYY